MRTWQNQTCLCQRGHSLTDHRGMTNLILYASCLHPWVWSVKENNGIGYEQHDLQDLIKSLKPSLCQGIPVPA